VALVVNSGMGTPFGDLRIARIGGAALASADRRGRATSVPVSTVQAPMIQLRQSSG
jgi:hypothetical protein